MARFSAFASFSWRIYIISVLFRGVSALSCVLNPIYPCSDMVLYSGRCPVCMPYFWVLVRNDAALTPAFFEGKKLKDRVLKAYYLARLSVVYNSIHAAIKKEVVQSGDHWVVCRESGSAAEVRLEADKLKRFLERPVSEYLKDNVRLSRFLHDRVIKKIAGLEFFSLVVGDFLSGIGIHVSIKETRGDKIPFVLPQ